MKVQDTYISYIKEKTINQLFEEQVPISANKIAVICKEQSITYFELNEKANQVAIVLREQGIQSNDIIALVCNRSIEMIVGILGILKAGGCYLPIDSNFPKSRVEYMIEDSRASIILTQKEVSKNFTFQNSVIYIDDICNHVMDCANVESINKSSDLAYVIYTSGSTGKPKGVMIAHKAVHNFIIGMLDKIEFVKTKKILSLTTISFDIFVLESLLPLITGMQIIISDPMNFIEYVEGKQFDMIQTTPSTIKLIMSDKKNRSYFKNITDIMIGGEAFPKGLYSELRKYTDAKIYNMYGPTETTVWSTVKLIESDENITIGNPIANTRVYVLDESFNEVKPSEVGELFIAGDGVSNGYLYQEELTKQRFIKEYGKPHGFMYQTSDLVQLLPNGELKYIGRTDSQVKVRGFRIELGEIEYWLNKFNGIIECVTSVKDSYYGEKQIIAYYIAENEIEISSINTYLKSKLPEYMLPRGYVKIDEIPKTPNGKVDRKNLPDMLGERPNLEVRYKKPQTTTEKRMAEIWMGLLQVNPIGIYDNFFDLGGNSILLSQLHLKIQEEYNNIIYTTDIFTNPTIQKLAQYIDKKLNINIDLKKKGVQKIIQNSSVQANKSDSIAIIGMSGRFAQSDNKEEYWKNIRDGVNCIRDFPEERKKDNQQFIKYSDYEESDYYKGGYLNNINQFDFHFFGISPLEADCMSPDQRIFLETAWHAIEDAGYAGKKITDTRTGVFVGHSTDFFLSYKQYIEVLNKDLEDVGVSGNLNSIIASRIAFYLNLTGPSMLIDTACSSSLVAVHEACNSIRNNECEMALAGGIRIDLLPLLSVKQKEFKLGILSSDGQVRAFDDSANGTGAGEGVGVVLLKSLEKALDDKDNIYAIIKGSAINQDGKSANLTSPNPIAQKNVILDAWKKSNISPESIAFIETHGTGTKLGDPIEVTGINEAFGQFTERKQFCAIGSVKSNIGHLDNASGIASLFKAVLSIQHRMIPPSINFNSPNKNIDFEYSPVYVSDHLQHMTDKEDVMRAGISSFGLSGTNCHLILEEMKKLVIDRNSENHRRKILTLSGNKREILKSIVWKYKLFLDENRDINLDDLCYTANTGRKHFKYRLAIIFNSYDELVKGLEQFVSEKEEIIVTAIDDLDSDYSKMLEDIAESYMKGTDFDWERLYRESELYTVSLPGYAFEKSKCWIEYSPNESKKKKRLDDSTNHPLLERNLADSINTIIYETIFNIENFWEVREHKVAGKCILPGTCYLEMILGVIKMHYSDIGIKITNVVLQNPLIIEEQEQVKVHTMINFEDGNYTFKIAGKKKDTSSDWNIHAEGGISFYKNVDKGTLDLDKYKFENDEKIDFFPYVDGEGIETGERWECLEHTTISDGKILAKLKLKEKFENETNIYHLHPALLDETINITLRSIGHGLYIPFTYKAITIYEDLPSEIYGLIEKTGEDIKNKDFATYNITLTDRMGEILVAIQDYCIKKVTIPMLHQSFKVKMYKKSWVENNNISKQTEKYNILMLYDKEDLYSSRLKELLCQRNHKVYCNREIDENTLSNIHKIIIMSQFSIVRDKSTVGTFQDVIEKNLIRTCNILRQIESIDNPAHLKVVVIGHYGVKIKQEQITVNPEDNALYGLVKGFELEKNGVYCRCIDTDDATNDQMIVQEIDSHSEDLIVSYRDNKRYVPILKEYIPIAKEEESIVIKSRGAYVITGGLGDLAMVCCRYLMEKGTVNLVLIYRSESTRDINELEKLKKSDSTVSLYKADVSDYIQMEQCFHDIIQKYEIIHGVFHLAGTAGNAFLRNKNMEQIRNVFNPKIYGTWIIDELNKKYGFEFVFLFSSVSSIMAEAGQADYCAANSYLDEFANYANANGRNYICINWPAWKETGMAVRNKVDFEKEYFTPISIKEGYEILELALRKQCNQVIIGKIKQFDTIAAKNPKKENSKVKITGRKNGDSYTKMEELLATTISSILKLSEININHSFTDIGGNSIVAIRVEAEMEKKGLPVSYSSLYNASSIKELAKSLNKQNNVVVIDNIEPFTEIFYKDCFYIQLFAVLKYYKKEIIYLLLQDIFAYTSFDGFSKDIFYIQNKNIIDCLFEMGIGVRTIEHSSNDKNVMLPDEEDLNVLSNIHQCLGEAKHKSNKPITSALEDMKAALLQQRPVILMVDCFYESIRLDTYQKEHWIHSLLLIGFDDSANEFTIVEHTHKDNLSYKIRKIDYDSLMESYIGYITNYQKHSGSPTYYEFYLMENSTDILDTIDYIQTYKENLNSYREEIIKNDQKLEEIITKINEFINDTESIIENIEQILKVLNNIIKTKQNENFVLKKLFSLEDNIVLMSSTIINKWIDIRKIFIVYSTNQEDEKLKLIPKLLTEIAEAEAELRKEKE